MVRLFTALCAWYARKKGWRFEGDIPQELKKCVIIVAPHTSGWDLIIGLAAYHHYQYTFRYFGKQELFRYPVLRRILLKTGGIPVDRFHAHHLVDKTVEAFNQAKQMYLVLSPEGTRAYRKKWRTGFYQIALKAKVPLLFGYLDYGRKTVGISEPHHLTGDKAKDFQVMRDFYKDITPFHPHKWEPEFY